MYLESLNRVQGLAVAMSLCCLTACLSKKCEDKEESEKQFERVEQAQTAFTVQRLSAGQ